MNASTIREVIDRTVNKSFRSEVPAEVHRYQSQTEAVTEGNESVTSEVGTRGEFIATVTIDRPDARNALNSIVRAGLNDVFVTIEADTSVRVIVLTGGGGSGAFVAGAGE